MTAVDIQILRQQLGLSRRELAEQIGVSKRAVTAWEQGWRYPSGPAEKVLETLSQASK